MYRYSPHAAAGLLLLALISPGHVAQAATDGSSGPTVTRIVTLDSAPAAQQVRPGERAAARGAVDDVQDALVDRARDAGLAVAVRRRIRNVVDAVVVRMPADQVSRLAELPGVASVSKPVRYAMPERPTPVPKAVLEKALDRAADGAKSAGGADGDTPSGREVITSTDLTGVPEAHRHGHTGAGITVGIVDSGIAYDHPALGGGGFPNAKVLGGYDFADDDADPYDDKQGPAAGHGTHVAGIVAGSDSRIEGVAPDATLRAYRVFGTKNPPTDEIILAALDRAAADGVDVVNLSLGLTGDRSSSVLSLAVDHLVDSGIPVVASVGNGYAGPFNASAPAVAKGAIAVGSTYNTRVPALGFTLDDGSDTPVPYQESGRGAAAPATGGAPITPVASSCTQLPEGSLTGRIALFAPVAGAGGSTCRPMDLARTVAAAGAVAAIYHNPAEPPDSIPFSPCCGTTGIPLVSVRETDARRILNAPDAVRLTWGAYAGTALGPDLAGLMDRSSSWGPGNELEFKPDLAAPGGYILSALPPSLDWYGVMSGTSMAAPHTAGAIALLLQTHPGLSPDRIRTALQNTATPLAMTGDHTRGAQPVAQQGAGRIDVSAALDAVSGTRPTATPSELALGDLEGRVRIRRITVRNPTAEPVTYRIGQRNAVSAGPPYTSAWQATDAAGDASADGTGRLRVPAHGSASMTVHIEQPSGVAAGTLFGGWVELTRTGDEEPQIRVPYQGMAGDFDAVSAVNPTFSAINPSLDNPALRPGYYTFGKSVPVTVDLTDTSTGNDKAWVMLSDGYPMLARLRLQVLDAYGTVTATPYDAAWVGRNSGAGTGLTFYGWDGSRDNGTPAPAGAYRLRLVFDKALGDPDGAPGTETWTSPEVTLVR
ncbi:MULTISPECIES: S8 family serine peptidase [unclassified Streptomyces]|uniref:S8 family serine peptidase n=1 Tax=unclassified Streptomyces TaxID=2593676 RepID=UPI002DDA6DB4|nr:MULTISPECIES: S8 family serine peptidase [unclassified Streptomyces]